MIIYEDCFLFQLIYRPLYYKYSVDSTRLSLNEWLVEKNINIKVIFPSIAEGRDMLGLELPDDECERVQLILTIT